MRTRELAEQLAQAAAHFPWLGPVTVEGLLGLVRAELGNAEALEHFQPHGEKGTMSRAMPPSSILHILSGNTPHAGLQSLLRGLLIGTPLHRCKIPSAGLPELLEFKRQLSPDLARRVEIAPELPPHWLAEAEVVIVFGSDATAEHFRTQVRADQKFIAHAHRFSFGIIFDDPTLTSVPAAAQDVSLFDQQGCLSPHVIYVPHSIARSYAERLACEMQNFEAHTPRGEITLEEKTAIMELRNEVTFRASIDKQVGIWQSKNSTAWTVLLDPEPQFRASCLNRVVYIKPCGPLDVTKAVESVRQHLSTVGIYPATLENAEIAALTGAKRICPLGQMQYPPLTWHQDGLPVLSSLVNYVDFEPF